MSDVQAFLISVAIMAWVLYFVVKHGPTPQKMDEWNQRSKAWMRVNWSITLIGLGVFLLIYGLALSGPRGLNSAARRHITFGAAVLAAGIIGKFQQRT